MGARILRAVVVASVGALALPGAALAGVRYKVLFGDLYQQTNWTSNSSTDNGCYAGSFGDSGVTHLYMTAKRGAIVKVVPSGNPLYGAVLKGLKFSGFVHQAGTFNDRWTLDQNASLAECGQPTGPFYAPVSTADCGVKDIGPSDSNLELTVPLGHSPKLPPALVGSFYVRDPFNACPSDDPNDATVPMFERAKQPVSIFRRRTMDLEGAGASRSSGELYYRGLDDHSGDAVVQMHWELKLRRAR